jgi:uncharacterized repeat protein (TIGR03803 family)
VFLCLNFSEIRCRAEGSAPAGTLVQASNGLFYGTTSGGGAYFQGTIYRMTSTGALRTIYDFTGLADGSAPIAGLVQAGDGNLYGCCTQGGAGATGTIFRITPAGSFTLLYTFSAGTGSFPFFVNTDGDVVSSHLTVGQDGALYGAAYSGGANGLGTLFRITTSGDFSVLHTFSALDSYGNNPDGAQPEGSLTQGSDGLLYGTTQFGGANGNGTVFSISTGGAFTTLYSFSAISGTSVPSNADGAVPASGLVAAAGGIFYGTTTFGGANGGGTIFRISSTGVLTPLYSFSPSTDGSVPVGSLALDKNGDLYGTCYRSGANYSGTVFRYSHKGTFTLLHTFGPPYTANADGSQPYAGLVQGTDGRFYGAALGGGLHLSGTLFGITRSGVFTTLHAFTPSYDGNTPYDRLLLGTDGNLYGTASAGGASNTGTLFEILPSGLLTTIYSFSPTSPSSGGANKDGAAPYAGLAQSSIGWLYGVTTAGGAAADGTIFTKIPAGGFKTLHSFMGLDGSDPVADLTVSRTGTLYGVTKAGGLNGSGTIFMITPQGNFTSLYAFTALDSQRHNADGAFPIGAVVLDAQGNVYGTTSMGGSNGDGTIFKLSRKGTLTTLYTFTGGNDGMTPQGALLLAADGNLYGTTTSGGAFGGGTAFQVTTAGALTTIHAFGEPFSNDGAAPIAGLVQAADQTFYGTTLLGGEWGAGTLFHLAADGNELVLFHFDSYPLGGVVFGSDGSLYGTTPQRGTYNVGMVYRITTNGTFTTIHSFR